MYIHVYFFKIITSTAVIQFEIIYDVLFLQNKDLAVSHNDFSVRDLQHVLMACSYGFDENVVINNRRNEMVATDTGD